MNIRISIIAAALLLIATSCTSSSQTDTQAEKRQAANSAAARDGISPPPPHEAAVIKPKSAPKADELSALEATLFTSPVSKGTLFCGYYSSSCETGSSDSSIVLISKNKDGYQLERFGHEPKSRENDPKEYFARLIDKVPETFTSTEDKNEKIQVYSTCNAAMKNNESCSLTLARNEGHERIFRGFCSVQGVREFYRPCSGEKIAGSGNVRKTKLTYGKKTFELPLLFQGQMPNFPVSTLSADNFAKIRSLVVGRRVGDLPAWAAPGSWDDWFSFPPADWSKSQYSIMAATLPPAELAFLLLQPASRFDELVVRDAVQAPKAAMAVLDGRDCDQEGMVVGFAMPGDAPNNRLLDGLFIDKTVGKLSWKRGLKAYCH